jgi:hypothetical protein
VTKPLPRLWSSLGTAVILGAIAWLGITLGLPADTTGSTHPLTSWERANLMEKACQTSDDVAVVTISSKECVTNEETVLTRYVTQIDEQFKGTMPPDSILVFYENGGTVDDRSVLVTGTVPFTIGSSYLIFTINCANLPGAVIFDHTLVAEIYESTAVIRNPQMTVTRQALLDSVTVAIDSCSVQYQKAQAALVVRGLIEWHEKNHPAPRPWYSGGIVSLNVGDILYHSDGPMPSVGASLLFSTRAGSWSLLAPGESPIVAQGQDVVVFLRREDDKWVLARSAYAKYRVISSMAYVEAERGKCLMQPAVLDSLPLQTLYYELAN